MDDIAKSCAFVAIIMILIVIIASFAYGAATGLI